MDYRRHRSWPVRTCFWYRTIRYYAEEKAHKISDGIRRHSAKFDNDTRFVAPLAGSLEAVRHSHADHWLVYDISRGGFDAIFVGRIAGIYSNPALAPIVKA